MDEKLRNSLQKIIDMCWSVEKHHWEELENPDDHLFIDYNNVKNYLEDLKRR